MKKRKKKSFNDLQNNIFYHMILQKYFNIKNRDMQNLMDPKIVFLI